MFKGCRRDDTAPHIYGLAQAAYRNLLTTRQDQSIVLLGKSGSGKTTNCQHIIQYLVTVAGSTNRTFSSRLERMSSEFKKKNKKKLANIIIDVVEPPFPITAYDLYCSGKMAGSLHCFGGFWECFYVHEWQC